MSEPIASVEPEIDAGDVMSSPGEQLRVAREARGESLKDVAARTHQSIDTLKKLEAMQTDEMSATLIRMHAKRYAAALDLPPDEIANAYVETRAMMRVSERADIGAQGWLERFKVPAIGLAVCALGFSGFAVFLGQSSEPSRLSDVPISTRVLPQAAGSELVERGLARKTIPANEFALRAKRAGWIEVRASDGTIFR
ncbi:MAG: helix-turn-helix domain-containing protein, partial [Pseudomonadota bacterium]